MQEEARSCSCVWNNWSQCAISLLLVENDYYRIRSQPPLSQTTLRESKGEKIIYCVIWGIFLRWFHCEWSTACAFSFKRKKENKPKSATCWNCFWRASKTQPHLQCLGLVPPAVVEPSQHLHHEINTAESVLIWSAVHDWQPSLNQKDM